MTKPGYSTTFVRSVNQYPVRWPVTAATQEPDRRFRRPVKRVNVRYKSRQFRGYLGGAGSNLSGILRNFHPSPNLVLRFRPRTEVVLGGLPTYNLGVLPVPLAPRAPAMRPAARVKSGRLPIRLPAILPIRVISIERHQLLPTALGANNITTLSFGLL